MGYELIINAKAQKKGGIIAKIIAVSESSSGVGPNGDWKKQTVTLQDNSGEMEMVLWGDQIGKLDQGQYYKIEDPFWSMYKEQIQLSLGKFGKLHLASVSDLMGDTPVVAPPPGQTQIDNTGLPKIPVNLKEFVEGENLILLAIEKIIDAQHKALNIPENGQRLGMHARAIYEQTKKSNLIKASELR